MKTLISLNITPWLLFVSVLCFSAKGQVIQFEQVLPLAPAPQITNDFIGVSKAAIAFADIDGDGDLDVLITGSFIYGITTPTLFINDGNGNYSKVIGSVFDKVNNSSVAFADIDGDGDQDVLITGKDDQGDFIAKLYENDGNGNFTELLSTPFDGVEHGSIAFADVDGDGDQDVLITGKRPPFGIAKLYLNDGLGNFTEMTGTPFEEVQHSAAAFADIDNDGDLDVIITGTSFSNGRITKLYENDGNGNYLEVNGTSIEDVYQGDIAFADVDGDGYQDLLITGQNASNDLVSKLYINDGFGNFSESTSNLFDAVRHSSVAFADVDGDGDQDLLITGANNIYNTSKIAKLYINDGGGNFSEDFGSSLEGVNYSSVAFGDIDNDGDFDILITGSNQFQLTIAKLYVNDGLGMFQFASGSSIEGVRYGSVEFADIDGDGDQDVFITGGSNTNQNLSILYGNDGNGNFTELSGSVIDGVSLSSVAFSDIDGDGDQDLLITGNSGLTYDRIAKLYANDGSGNFTEVSGTPFDGVERGSIAFADIDGDGDQDVLITGENVLNERIAKLYSNDGSGSYSEVPNTPFEGVFYSAVAFADVDGDGDQDVLITGRNSSNTNIASLYINDGSGSFTEVTGTPFDAVSSGSVAFADVDGDGDQDVLITGQNASNDIISKLYINDGSGTFTEATNVTLDGVRNSSIAFADFDGDGDQDIFISGLRSGFIDRISKLYVNDGMGNFTEETGTPFIAAGSGSANVADIDGDGYQDLLLTGESNTGSACISILYRGGVCWSTTGTDQISTCDSLSWIDGITYTTSNNTAEYTLTNAAGCDSIVTLDLTITNSFEETDSIITCTSAYFWPVDGNTYTQSGIYTAQFTNQSGCDSTHVLDLTIDCSLYANVSVTNSNGSTCDGEAQANVYFGLAPYSYLYSNGETAPIAENLCSGIYDLTVTDSDMSSYQTVFVVTDLTIDYSNDPAYQDYQDSLFSSAVNDCDFDYNQPADSFYVDQNSIVQLDSNLYEVTWYVYQNQDTFIMTNVYYTTEDINGSLAFVLTMYCEDTNRGMLESATFIYKTKGPLTTAAYEKEKLKLYPNPSGGFFTLESELLGNSYTIVDAQGRLIQTGEVSSNAQIISLKDETVGVYYLKVGSEVLKMVKR